LKTNTDEERADKFVQPGDAMTVSHGDLSTSPAALEVLHTQGVQAWEAWVAEQAAGPRSTQARERLRRVVAAGASDPVVDGVDEALVVGDDEAVSGPPLDGERAGDLSGRRLKEYWTRGPGLAKWAGSATPWRTLREFLAEYLSGEKLDATTSAWYRIVFGRLPGQD
jgi:hypothetical protein